MMVNIILGTMAACIVLACFRQPHCAGYSLFPVLIEKVFLKEYSVEWQAGPVVKLCCQLEALLDVQQLHTSYKQLTEAA